MTNNRVFEPWQIVRTLLPGAGGSALPDHQIVTSALPMELGIRVSDDPQPVEAVLDHLFRQPPQDMPQRHVYVLLDAARSQFLPTRLETAGLDYCCLYDLSHNPDLGETAPWLVRLERDAAFTRATLAHDPASPDARKMLGDGIFLVSPLTLDEMRRHLKHYTALNDEVGVQQFFRLQEPGMLDALFCVADDAQRAGFFAGVSQMVYPWPSLEDGIWDFVSVSWPAAGAARGGPVPLVDQTARRSLAIFVNDRKARLLAVSDIPDPMERPAASWTFSRLMNAGFDHPPRLIETFRLLQRCPPDAHPSFWQQVEGGQYSLRHILLIYADHYRIKGIFEDV